MKNERITLILSNSIYLYANVFMLKDLGTGIKMYKKVDGQFKELNYAPQTDAAGKVHKKVTICQ